MSPLPLLVRAALTALLVALTSLSCSGQEQRTRRPNILFAMADDWGWPHAGAYGDEVAATPTFDRLAREGARFEHAFVSSPSCTPSRNAILTGQAFYRLGEGANLHSTLDVRHPTFVRLLADNGYETGSWRKAWGPGNAKAGGYDGNPCGKPQRFDEFLDGRDPERPFCFWFGTSDPHRGYDRDSGQKNGIDPARVHVPAFLPQTDVVRRDIADYYFEVQRWDSDVGEALQQLEARGLLDDTIIVMTGDHGMPFPRCKGNLYDWGARVPLAMRWGDRVARGRVVEDFVSLTDLAPTFLRAAGIAPPEQMTGRSLLPLVSAGGEPPASERRGFVTYGRERHTPAQKMPSLAGYPSRALRTDRWLLILNLEPERWPAGVPQGASHPMGQFADCDNGPTKALLREGADDPALQRYYRLCFARRPAVELYDCAADPDQVEDLAARPEYEQTVARLKAQLSEELQRTADPRFAADATPGFDAYPYRAGYLQKHLEKNGHGGK